jgi:integrase
MAKWGQGTVYKRGKTYWIKYYQNGKPYYESSKSDKYADAARLLSKRLADITDGKQAGLRLDKVMLAELVQNLKDDYNLKGQKRPRTTYLEKFFDSFRVVDVTSTEITRFINFRKEYGAANATINRELSALKKMLNLGAKSSPPKVDRVPHITMLEENNVKKGFFKHQDFLKFREALPYHLKNFVTFAYKTGWRFSEISNLTWKQIDRKNNVVRLDAGTTKNKQGRVIYLDSELQDIIQQQFVNQLVGCKYVFHRVGHRINDFRVIWNTICRQIGLGYGYRINGKYVKKWENKYQSGPTMHDFRRSAVRNMVRAGIPERVAMSISGHKTRSVFERYNIVDEEDLKAAAEQQEKYLAQM